MILKENIAKLPILAEGGEGIIYEYNSKLIKFYKDNVDKVSKEKKIKLLMNKSLPKEVIAPLDIVYDRNNCFIGYVMNKIDGEEFKKLANKKFVKANNITKKEILYMLNSMQNVLNELHKQDLFIGDLNDQNILFDKSYNIYIIDCDSWTIDDEKCEVAMDLFKDPMLVSNEFNDKTDTYAFSILSWKALTRIHPFGGTMQPDIGIAERMKKGISVIGNKSVTIPRTIGSWAGLSPELLSSLKLVFENKSRQLHQEIDDLYNHLKYCNVDNDYYYDKYNACPVCNGNAKIAMNPVKQGTVQSGLRLVEILSKNNIKVVINENTYIDNDDYIVNIKTGKKVKYKNLIKYHFDLDDILIEEDNKNIIIHSNIDYEFTKKYKSSIVVQGNKLYYISKQNTLTEVTITKNGNSFKNLCKCSNTCYFDVSNGRYFVVNCYQGKIIFDNNEMILEFAYNKKVVNYGIHYDNVSGKWLVILENDDNSFNTFVFSENHIIYECERIKFSCQLSNVCMSNSTIFIPIDGKIRGFSYSKDIYKDFECSVVTGDSKLIKNGNKFTIINDENIYALS